MTYTKIKFEIKRKPPPPALEPFECLGCRKMIERDPRSPDFQAPPICLNCTWVGQGRLQTRQLPYSMWAPFRTAYALLYLLDKEMVYARHRQ